MELTIQELKTIKEALNSIISQRQQHKLFIQENTIKWDKNEEYLKQEYDLLERTIKELDIRKLDNE